MVIFKTVRMKNFLSFGNHFTEIPLCERYTTLVSGTNGSGKSSMLLDSICYGLFNKPYRNINKPQLLNSINKKNLVVEVEFEIGRDDYLVRRGMKPNVFEIFKNGKMLDQDAAIKDQQAYLEKVILQFNYKAFIQIVVVGSSTFTPFMQLPASHRREIIEDLLDLRVFSSMNVLLRDRISHTMEESKTVERQYNQTNELISVHLQNSLENQKRAETQKESLRADVEQGKADILGYKANIDALVEQLQSIPDSSEKIASTRKQIKSYETQLTTYKTQRRQREKAIKFFTDNDHCPTCNQELADDFADVAISRRQEQIQDIDDAISKVDGNIETLNEKLDGYQDSQIERDSIKSKIAGYKRDIKAETAVCKRLLDQIKQISSDVVDNSEEISRLNEQKQALQDRKQSLFEELKHQQVALEMLKDRGIKAKIISQYIPLINQLMNEYLTEMEFFAQFELDENFNETIKSRFRDNFQYNSFSEGEKMRINMAILLTWRKVASLKNSMATNLLILDETGDSSLDGIGVDNFLNLLKSNSNGSNIFIISHSLNLLDRMDGSIKVEKHKQFSTVTVEG